MSIRGRSTLDAELSELNTNILKLGSLAEEAIGDAMHSLEQRSLALAQQVIVGDEQINLLRGQIEQHCLRLLATQFPAASDLRRVIAVIHIATELERIGDHASGIARLVERMDGEPPIANLYQLPKMSNRAKKMIRASLQAYISQSADKAYEVIDRDEKINRSYGKFLNIMLEDMTQSSKGDSVTIQTYLLWMAHNLERIGDRVTNIAERVIFMVTGELVELDSESM